MGDILPFADRRAALLRRAMQGLRLVPNVEPPVVAPASHADPLAATPSAQGPANDTELKKGE